MSPERWARVKEIFHAALEREEKDRPEFVARACGADKALCEEIESLLREHSTAPPITSPVRQPDLSGQTITHYRILGKLGHGGMGLVYKAQDLKLGRTVALKFLAPHALAGQEYRTRFIQEAKALAAIDHPHICTIHEIDEAKGQIFFAMTFVDGPTLKEKIAGRPMAGLCAILGAPLGPLRYFPDPLPSRPGCSGGAGSDNQRQSHGGRPGLDSEQKRNGLFFRTLSGSALPVAGLGL